MQMNYVYAGNFPMRGQYTDYEADKLIENLSQHVQNMRKVPADTEYKPQFQVIEGGRK